MRAAARVLLDILVALSVSAAAQAANGPLGIALEGWSYPFRVHFREFALEGQPLRRAHMDLPPATAPNGHAALRYARVLDHQRSPGAAGRPN